MGKIRLRVATIPERGEDCQFSAQDGGYERLEGSVLSIDCRRDVIETRGTTRSGNEVLCAKSGLLEDGRTRKRVEGRELDVVHDKQSTGMKWLDGDGNRAAERKIDLACGLSR